MKLPLHLPLLALAACGYAQGFIGDDMGIRTLAIRTVENGSFRQDMDILLSRRLSRDLSAFTGFVPASPSQADGILEVEILDARGRLITEEAEGKIKEGAIRLSARYRILDRRSGRILRKGRSLDWAEFRVPVGEDQSSAIREAVTDLSRKILLSLQDR